MSLNQNLPSIAQRFGFLNDNTKLLAFLKRPLGYSLCSFILGFITTFGFAPYEMWLISLIALAFELSLVANLKSKKQVFTALLIYFTTLNATTLEWLNFVMQGFGGLPFIFSWLIEIIFSAYLAIFHALFACIAFALAHKKIKEHNDKSQNQHTQDEDDDYYIDPALERGTSLKNTQAPTNNANTKQKNTQFVKEVFLLAFLPIAFVLADFVIGFLFTGFPWMYFGYIAINGPFASYAPLIGVRGISLILFVCAASLALAIERRYIYFPIAGALFAIAILTMGIDYTKDLDKIKVTGIQGNIEQSLKWDPRLTLPTIDKYINASLDYFTQSDLIIWPESAVPVYVQQIEPLLHSLNLKAYDTKSPLLIGIQRLDHTRQSFNSMYLLGQSEDFSNAQIYDKRQLVPFGEIVPFEKYTRKLGGIFNFPMSSFTQGEYEQKQIHLKDKNLYFTPAICYESIFPELMLSANDHNTNGIIMISNDSWYGDTRGPFEHLAIARMRSMEVQKPMIRITNSGVTAFIDKFGNVVKSLPQNQVAILDVEFAPNKGQTPYSKIGNLGIYILLIILLIFGVYMRQKESNLMNSNLQELIRP